MKVKKNTFYYIMIVCCILMIPVILLLLPYTADPYERLFYGGAYAAGYIFAYVLNAAGVVAAVLGIRLIDEKPQILFYIGWILFGAVVLEIWLFTMYALVAMPVLFVFSIIYTDKAYKAVDVSMEKRPLGTRVLAAVLMAISFVLLAFVLEIAFYDEIKRIIMYFSFATASQSMKYYMLCGFLSSMALTLSIITGMVGFIFAGRKKTLSLGMGIAAALTCIIALIMNNILDYSGDDRFFTIPSLIICLLYLVTILPFVSFEKISSRTFKRCAVVMIVLFVISVLGVFILPSFVVGHEEGGQHMGYYETVDENGNTVRVEEPGIIEYYTVYTPFELFLDEKVIPACGFMIPVTAVGAVAFLIAASKAKRKTA